MPLACPACDHLFDCPVLQPLEAAHCPRCDHHLTTHNPHAVNHALALAMSGLLLLLCATAYPFLGFAASGQVASMTLLDSAVSLFAFGQPMLAGIVFVLILAGPVCLLACLILLLVALHWQIRSPHLPGVARWLTFLNSWNMVEVFLIGTLVSLVKISSMATVHLGFAFWAFVGFTLCTVASVATIDRVQLWRAIARLTPR